MRYEYRDPDAVRQRLRRRLPLVAAAGNGALLADLLGVRPSQVTRWRQGAQWPSPESARAIMDFAYILARAEPTMHEKVVPIWLDSPSQFLRGSTPRECIKLGRIAGAVAESYYSRSRWIPEVFLASRGHPRAIAEFEFVGGSLLDLDDAASWFYRVLG